MRENTFFLQLYAMDSLFLALLELNCLWVLVSFGYHFLFSIKGLALGWIGNLRKSLIILSR